MKRYVLLAFSVAVMLSASCQKSPITHVKGNGSLSFSSFSLDVDDEVITKAAEEAGGEYVIKIYDKEGIQYGDAIKYADVLAKQRKISLPAGEYTLEALSTEQAVPNSAWESPVYGVTKSFSITAGQETELGSLTCKLVQCKVTVAYSDEFLEKVTGACNTSVTLKAGYPLEYSMTADGNYDKRSGYFAVEGHTLDVEFKGNFDGKNATMRKSFSGIEPQQWRQIRFVLKKAEQGNATFDIEINQLVSDEVLNDSVEADDELALGPDPDKPLGDGGITIYPDYAAGCDAEISDLSNMLIVPESERKMSIKLKAVVPNGILKFYVTIDTDNTKFKNAVDAAISVDQNGKYVLNLIEPEPKNAAIFQVVPFKNGPELLGMTEVDFDLSNAQGAIVSYPGHHTFTMYVMDETGCENTIPVTMVVEE